MKYDTETILGMSPVYMAMDVSARTKLKMLSRKLNTRVKLGIEPNKAQKIIRKCWYRWRLYTSLCFSKKVSLKHLCNIFESPYSPTYIISWNDSMMSILAVILCENGKLLNKIFRERLIKNEEYAKNTIDKLKKDKIFDQYNYKLILKKQSIINGFLINSLFQHKYSNIISRKDDIIRHVSYNLFNIEKDANVNLSVNSCTWIDCPIPIGTVMLRFNFGFFPIIATPYSELKITIRNADHSHMLINSCTLQHNERILTTRTAIEYMKPPFLEAIDKNGNLLLLSKGVPYNISNGSICLLKNDLKNCFKNKTKSS